MLAGLVIYATTVASGVAALNAFVIATATTVLVLLSIAALIGLAQVKTLQKLKGSTHQMKGWGGFVLLLVGVWRINLSLRANPFALLCEPAC